jgi:hypothetical protein
VEEIGRGWGRAHSCCAWFPYVGGKASGRVLAADVRTRPGGGRPGARHTVSSVSSGYVGYGSKIMVQTHLMYWTGQIKAGHSGYPKNSGRVIRVVGNSGIKNCYPIFVLKKHYSKFRVPDNSGSGFTQYTRN